MPAINGVKKSAAVKKNSAKRGGSVLTLSILVTLVLTLLVVVCFWKFYYEGSMRDQFLMETQDGQTQVYKATRDISSGEYVDGAIELVAVPSYLMVKNSVAKGTSLSELKASGNIKANTIITSNNTYDPEMQDPIIGTSRLVQVDYLKIPGVSEGDFIDIRLKVSVDGKLETYRDDIICAKKEVLNVSEDGNVQFMLNESEILNINSAVIESAVKEGSRGDIYVTKYIDPSNQPKAVVTYDGKGISYTEKELIEAQDVLRKNQTNDTDTEQQIEDTVTDEENNTAEFENMSSEAEEGVAE